MKNIPKKKLLFITKNFPPEIGGGLRRIEAIYNILLANKNIDLQVVTTVKEKPARKKYENVNYIKQFFFKDKKKESITNFQNTKSKIKFIDKALIGWLPNVLLYIIFKKYDFVFASCPTFTNIVIGFLYKAFRFGRTKFIIEYRDFFSLNPSFVENFAKKALSIFERIIIRKSDYIIATTNGMKDILSKITDPTKIFLVKNYISSYDIEKLKHFKKIKIIPRFYNIGHIGKLNTGRNPAKILRLLEHKAGGKKICLYFVGVNDDEIAFIKNEANRINLDSKRIFFQHPVNRETSLKLMKSFDGVILIINSDASIKYGYGIPGKIYDYIYANNNIFSDKETFLNLKSEFKCKVIRKFSNFINFSVIDKKILDIELNKILNRIVS